MRPVDPRLFRSVPQARRPVVVLALVGVAQGVATIGTAFALAALVTSVVVRGDLRAPAAALAATFAVRALLAGLAEHTAACSGVEVSGALRRQLLSVWLTRPEDERPDPATASTLAAQGCTSIETYVSRFLPALVHAATLPVLALGCLVVVDWPSALVVALTLPLLPLFAALIGRTTQDATRRRWTALTALSGHFLDVVQGLPTLVGYGRAERQVDSIRTTSGRHRVETMATLRLAFLSSAALEALATISVALVAVTVGLRLTGGGLSLQTGLLAILLAPEAYWPIRRVGAEFHAAADGAQALRDVLDQLTTAPVAARRPEPVATDATVTEVVLTDVDYTFRGSSSPVLRGVGLTAGVGLTVITGPSGCGKSTLLELVAGLRTPSAGVVSTPSAHLVTQRPFLVAGSVRANLTLGVPDDPPGERLWSALRLVGLDGVVAGLPTGLDTLVGDDGFGLSAGQRARLAVARAWLSPCAAVLLDEPTAHLDPAAVTDIHDAIVSMAQDRVVVAVSHRPELLDLADQHVALGRPERHHPVEALR